MIHRSRGRAAVAHTIPAARLAPCSLSFGATSPRKAAGMKRGDYVRMKTGGQRGGEAIIRVCRITGKGMCTVREIIGTSDGDVRGLRRLITSESEFGSSRMPTPRASDARRGDCKAERERRTPSFVSAVKRVPTPHGFSKDGGRSNGPSGNELGRAVNRMEWRDGGSLNPSWVEWLMGWPIGWTAYESYQMDKFQRWLRSHGG